MSNIAVITTFPNRDFEIYARQMLQSFVQFWPQDIPLLVQLDDELLVPDVNAILASSGRKGDAIAVGWLKDHKAFVERNQGKDHPQDYRKQAVRFCHKVFSIKRALDSIKGGENPPRYLIWLDADVHTARIITADDLKGCLPKDGDAVAYMGRKDWDHSECGWLAFDLENDGDTIIDNLVDKYKTGSLFEEPQWHDSWLFDRIRKSRELEETTSDLPRGAGFTNLTPNANGRDIWPQSPMGKWSTHHKGPAAKAKLGGPQPMQQPMRITVQTKNSIPHEEIRKQIAKNQQIIKNWIKPCIPTDEELVVVSAGPMLVAEDVRTEVEAGKKIVAVKNALVPLKAAGIIPWGCILLDPRPHVADFVQDADPRIIWFVASQVNPTVTLELLARGCTVWGYHANVNAGEESLIMQQQGAIVSGGSATATRGLYTLHHLGFSNFSLYGYDLCLPDKPDMNKLDEFGQPKYMEMTVNLHDPFFLQKRMFFTEAQYYAQFEEMNDLVRSGKFKLKAYGDGVVPFMIKGKAVADMRREELRKKIMGDKPQGYAEMLTA